MKAQKPEDQVMSEYILQRDVCPSQRIKITQESHAEGRDRLKPGTCQRAGGGGWGGGLCLSG